MAKAQVARVQSWHKPGTRESRWFRKVLSVVSLICKIILRVMPLLLGWRFETQIRSRMQRHFKDPATHFSVLGQVKLGRERA